MSAAVGVAAVLAVGLVGPLVLYSLIRSETEPERTDRASALRRARRDGPGHATNEPRADDEWGADARTDRESDGSDGEWGVEDDADDPWNR